jgi:rhodanese-related sulfurtransferase
MLPFYNPTHGFGRPAKNGASFSSQRISVDFLVDNIVLVLAAVISGGMLLWPMLNRGSSVGSLNTLGATQMLNSKNAILIDVREGPELARGAVPQARHMPMSAFAQTQDALVKEAQAGKQPKPVIVMCASGMRSQRMAKKLREAGLTEVYNLEGGFDAWRQAGLPVKSQGKA